MPNILITGTPGTGKTTLGSLIASKMQSMTHLELSKIILKHRLHSGKDKAFDTMIIDDDVVCEFMIETFNIDESRHFIVDFHSCDLFPPHWFDLVVILRTETDQLYPRLESRNYNPKKLEENMDCEIFQVCLDQAKEVYNNEMIMELNSNSNEEMETNLDKIVTWLKSQDQSKQTTT